MPTPTTDERLDQLERRCAELASELDRANRKREDLERSVAALESRRLTVADIPIAALLRKFEMCPLDVDAALFLMPGSVTPELLAPKAD